MSVLPIVDLFILAGTGSVAVGFVLKAVAMTTIYNPSFLGFSSSDMLMIAGVSFAMAAVVTMRTWLKLNEPRLQDLQRRIGEEHARERARELREPGAAYGDRQGEGAENGASAAEVRAAAIR